MPFEPTSYRISFCSCKRAASNLPRDYYRPWHFFKSIAYGEFYSSTHTA